MASLNPWVKKPQHENIYICEKSAECRERTKIVQCKIIVKLEYTDIARVLFQLDIVWWFVQQINHYFVRFVQCTSNQT